MPWFAFLIMHGKMPNSPTQTNVSFSDPYFLIWTLICATPGNASSGSLQAASSHEHAQKIGYLAMVVPGPIRHTFNTRRRVLPVRRPSSVVQSNVQDTLRFPFARDRCQYSQLSCKLKKNSIELPSFQVRLFLTVLICGLIIHSSFVHSFASVPKQVFRHLACIQY